MGPRPRPEWNTVERRALQLGLRRKALEEYGRCEVVEVIVVSEFVAEQREALRSGGKAALTVPVEEVYRPADPAVAQRLGLETH